MPIHYKDKIPVAFSEESASQHLRIPAKAYERLSNKVGPKYKDADPKRIELILDDLRKIRLAQNSTGGEIRIYGRSINTSQALLKTIHPKIRKDNFVEVIGISDTKQNWSKYPWPRIAISERGVMTSDDRKLLYSDLDHKVLVMMSGGEGRSDQPFYRPIAKFMSELINREMFVWAVCMSYQVLADQVMHIGIKRGQNVPPPREGRFHFSTQIVDITDEGKKDTIFKELAPGFGVESYNHFRIYGADIQSNKPSKNVHVLARDHATKEIIAFRIGETCWAIQYHPELKKIGRAGKGIQKRKSLSINGKSVIVPKGIHPYQIELVKRIRKQGIVDKYNMTTEDIQQFFHPVRRVHNVGDQISLAILEQAVVAKKRELGV